MKPTQKEFPQIGIGATEELSLRVSAATLSKVLFNHPETGRKMLALERTATSREKDGGQAVYVIAKPFGGGVQINDPVDLEAHIGKYHFDSQRSRYENDFRILIHPSRWEKVKSLCLQIFNQAADTLLETSPERELVEELEDALKTKITSAYFRINPAGVVIEGTPKATASVRAAGLPTVRIYKIFEVHILASSLVSAMLENSARLTGQDQERQVQADLERGRRGRASAVLTLPLQDLIDFYLDLPLEARNEITTFDQGIRLGGNVPAVLEEVGTSKYERRLSPKSQ